MLSFRCYAWRWCTKYAQATYTKPELAFSAVSSNFEKCRPEEAGDVISGMALDYVGMDVPAKLGNSRSNGSGDIRFVDFMSNEQTNMTAAFDKGVNAF